MADHPAEQVEQLTRVILSISDSLWRYYSERDEIRLAGLPTEVVREIINNPGITMQEVADRLHKFPSNISVALRELGERGLIERIRDENDRRAQRLYPSASALHGVRNAFAAWGSLVQRALNDLTPDEVDRVLAAVSPLTKVQHALRA